jgi:hypothetical protein
VSATLPKRFSLSLTQERWVGLLEELQVMERDHGLRTSGSVEKLFERARAGEQLLVFVRCVVEESRAQPGPMHEPLRRDVPLLRATAKYLLTACDRLRRAALHQAWRRQSSSPLTEVQAALDEAKLWDVTMRELSLQHGVVHPLSEMVEPLPLGEAELQQLGLPCEQLLNGEDLLAS